jgi:hypothetical protein
VHVVSHLFHATWEARGVSLDVAGGIALCCSPAVVKVKMPVPEIVCV